MHGQDEDKDQEESQLCGWVGGWGVEGGCEGRVEAGTADGVDYRGKERIRFMDSA